MNWTLANPALLPLAALVAVPVLVHLFARSRPRTLSFSSTEFIRQIVRKQMNVKRPQDWLLLVIRTLLVATLIALFLQPVLLSEKNAVVTNRSVVVIVDATASMNYPEGVQTRFATACVAASRQLDGLAQGDRANLIFLKANPESVYPEPGVNAAHLQDLLRRARCTQETGNLAAPLSAAVSQLGKSPGSKEIIVISDFQSSNWANDSFAVPADMKLTRLRIGSGVGSNGAVTAIHADPPQPLLGESVNLLVEVANFSADEAHRTVFLELPDQRLSQEVSIPAWGRASTLFRIKASTAGLIPAVASLNEDAFTADDRRWLVLPVKDHIRVGLFAGESTLAEAWAHAFSVLPFVRVQRLTAEELTGELPCDVLFLSGWSGEGAESLQRQAAAGTVSIFCSPKPDAPVASVAKLAGTEAPAGEVLRWQSVKDRVSAEVVAKQDRVFELFSKGNFGNPSSGMVKGHLGFSAGVFPQVQTLIQYADKTPALARLMSSGRGQVYLWNIPLDPAQSDWAAKVEFLPLMGELLLKSQGGGEGESSVQELAPGGGASFRVNRAGAGNSVELIGPGDVSIAVDSITTTQGVRLNSAPLPVPGLYVWKQKGRIIGYTIVHFPNAESDMRLLEKFNDGSTARQLQVTDLLSVPHTESPLWPMLLLLAVLLLALESGVLYWIGRKAV